MMPAIHDVLTRLIELTPLPPEDTEIDPMLAAFEAIIEQRATLLDRLAPPLQLGDAARALVLEIERRDVAWQDALTAAMRRVSQQRHGNEQLRAYAAVV
jgi:predicted ATPase